LAGGILANKDEETNLPPLETVFDLIGRKFVFL
jgi:hypothetical protein